MAAVSEDQSALVAFITARLDDDERTARAADSGERWEPTNDRSQVWAGYYVAVGPYEPAMMDEDDVAHITRFDPKRVIDEADAKRAMLPHLVVDGHRLSRCDRCQALRLLAAPYAWHPDFREEWAP